MTYEEYLEFDKLMWEGKETRRTKELLTMWQKLTPQQQSDFIYRKWRNEK